MSLRGESETISDLLTSTSVSAEAASALLLMCAASASHSVSLLIWNSTMNMETQILIRHRHGVFNLSEEFGGNVNPYCINLINCAFICIKGTH